MAIYKRAQYSMQTFTESKETSQKEDRLHDPQTPDNAAHYNWGERERAPSCGLNGRAVTIYRYIYIYIYI